MQKKALLALLLALTLLLSGCALIVKDEAVDNATVIIRKGDTEITKGELKEKIESELDSMEYYYSMYGYSLDRTDPNVIADAQESVIHALEEDIVSKEQIALNGLDQMTEEEEAEIQEKGQSDYDYMINAYKSSLTAEDETLDDETATERSVARLEELGLTLQTYVDNARETKLSSKLKDFIIKDVTVTDEDLQTEYESKVESAKSTYEENAAAYATAANNGTTLYYAPEGVRRVKQILTKFHDEDQEAIDAANTRITDANSRISAANAKISSDQEILDTEDADEESKAAAQADLDAANAELGEATAELTAANDALTAARETAYANLDEEVDAILAQLAEGADWETLMAEKNQDPGMQSGTTAEKGYAVAAGMSSFDSAFVDAAMALENIGDVSGKVRGDAYGYYIIKYWADEPVGEIGLDAVRETLTSSLLSTKQDETYDTTLHQWIEEAGFQVDVNAMKD